MGFADSQLGGLHLSGMTLEIEKDGVCCAYFTGHETE